MNPFYSIEDLADLFDFHTPQNIADALRAAGVAMIYNGQEADLSQWKRSGTGRNSDGALVAVRGWEPYPDPDDVVVSFESLPSSWQLKIVKAEQQVELAESEPHDQPPKAIDPRREKTLLRIIKALDVMSKLPERGATSSIIAQLEKLGFETPGEDVVTKVISKARSIKPD